MIKSRLVGTRIHTYICTRIHIISYHIHIVRKWRLFSMVDLIRLCTIQVALGNNSKSNLASCSLYPHFVETPVQPRMIESSFELFLREFEQQRLALTHTLDILPKSLLCLEVLQYLLRSENLTVYQCLPGGCWRGVHGRKRLWAYLTFFAPLLKTRK